MGSHGELWSRMRGRGSGGSDKSYFYCELTGTFAKEIFDYHSDVDQKGSSTLSCGLSRLLPHEDSYTFVFVALILL